jgi:hypothetical protein
MNSSNNWVGRYVSLVLILSLAFPMSEAGLARAQQASQNAPTVPDREVGSALPEAPEPANTQTASPGQQAAPSQPADGQSQEKPHRPVGAAAAPYEPTLGIAASRPAGAAIAPAKQRRVRTILISLGVIAGAGIAVGSVAALSHGSPSRP